MPETEPKQLDRWADWLLRGRQRGLTEAQTKRMASQLPRMRDRVVGGARLRRGERVLDIGAGTGLIALEAGRRVGPSGSVVALDISRDALEECLRQSGSDGATAPLAAVVADGLRLPFAGATFDAVFTRSVLIYVGDKASAIREMHRVLRPGGRASIFEPINSASAEYTWRWGLDLRSAQAAHDRVVAHLQANWDHRETMMGFDERDLLRWFVEAGFSPVQMRYEYGFARQRRGGRNAAAGLATRPNPSMMSYEEAARAVLGNGADDYLLRLSRILVSQPVEGAGAAAYVVARKEKT